MALVTGKGAFFTLRLKGLSRADGSPNLFHYGGPITTKLRCPIDVWTLGNWIHPLNADPFY